MNDLLQPNETAKTQELAQLENLEAEKASKVSLKFKIIACVVAGIIIVAGIITFATYRYYHQYDSTVFTSAFTSTNYKKFWIESQSADTVKSQYDKTRSLAKSVLLSKFYSGHTVYLDKDGKSFIISGTTPFYLIQSGSTWDLSDKDKTALRSEYDQKAVYVGSQAQAYAISGKIKDAADYIKANEKTALAVNGELVNKNIGFYTDGKGNELVDAAEVLPKLGVKYSVKNGVMICSFTDALGGSHSFQIGIATLEYQPWVDKANKNTYPAITLKSGRYYIAKQILVNLFGFDFSYDKTKGIIKIMTDSDNTVQPAVDAPMTIEASNATDVSLAVSLGVLNGKGALSADAQTVVAKAAADKAAADKAAADKVAADKAAADNSAADKAAADNSAADKAAADNSAADNSAADKAAADKAGASAEYYLTCAKIYDEKAEAQQQYVDFASNNLQDAIHRQSGVLSAQLMYNEEYSLLQTYLNEAAKLRRMAQNAK